MARCICAILTVIFVGLTTGTQYDLTFKNCYAINYCNDQTSYRLTYDGESIASVCEVTFHGYDKSNSQNKYKTCIRATEWKIYDKDVILKYFSGHSVLINNLRQIYSAHDNTSNPTTEWCSEPDEYVDVQLTTSRSILTQERIQLEVYAVKTFDYGKMVGIIVGSILGSLVVIGIIVTIIIIIACRKKRQPGSVLSNSYAGGANQTSGFGNAPCNFNTAPPSYYSTTHNQHPAYILQNTAQPNRYPQ